MPEASTLLLAHRSSSTGSLGPTSPLSTLPSEIANYVAVPVDEYQKLVLQAREEKVKSIARDLESDRRSPLSSSVPSPSKFRRASSPAFHDAYESPDDITGHSFTSVNANLANSDDTEETEDAHTVRDVELNNAPANFEEDDLTEERLLTTAKSLGLVVLSTAEMQSIQDNASETLKALELSKLEAKSLEESRANATKALEEKEAQSAKVVAQSQAEAVRAIQLAKAAAEEAQAEASRIIRETKTASTIVIEQSQGQIDLLQNKLVDLEKKFKRESTDEYLIKKRAADRGLVVVTKNDYDYLKRSSQSSEALSPIAASLAALTAGANEPTISRAVSISSSTSPVLSTVAPAGLDTLSTEDISAAAVKKGFVVISQKSTPTYSILLSALLNWSLLLHYLMKNLLFVLDQWDYILLVMIIITN